jgi:hypothetical protein
MKGRTRVTPHKRVNTVVVRRVSHEFCFLLTNWTPGENPLLLVSQAQRRGWIVALTAARPAKEMADAGKGTGVRRMKLFKASVKV